MIDGLKKVLKDYWGYDEFRPLQKEAMLSAASGRDSVVVLPTGGGKSLCFQVPAMVLDGLAIVVSPLISLMKDQVDTLRECGVAAARIDSSQTEYERQQIFELVSKGHLKLLYVSPERLMQDDFIEYIKQFKISMLAIDEAHCVSMWGHDFRPEYRQLGELKDLLPGVAIHAYTATATEKVRDDIAAQLQLENPEVVVGLFDRPNLSYKIQRADNKVAQICEVIDRHKNESGIVYCIRRKDVEELCTSLSAKGHKVLGYHAGMNAEARKLNQDAFIKESVDIVVATIAFGMGIDKSNVRYVIHAGMPKSLENYQQESGRAGRDGLEAECCMLYSGADYGIWKFFANDLEAAPKQAAMQKLNGMYEFCTGAICRHKAILKYFGQELEKANCGACDICLDGVECMEDPMVPAQKILSCVLRLDQRFGADYTAAVLAGSKDKRILESGHDELSTYGLLGDFSKGHVRDWIEQLTGQGYLCKAGEYNVLNVPEKGWKLLKGEETPRLLKPLRKEKRKIAQVSAVAKQSWEGVDRDLFEELRELRSELASEKRVPAFVIFGDATLRDMARKRPSTLNGFLQVSGVGHKKKQQYGESFMEVINEYCVENGVGVDLFE